MKEFQFTKFLIMKKTASIFFVIIFIACNTAKQPENEIQIDINEAKQIDFSDWFSDVDLIPLETNKSSLLYEVYKLIYEDNRFYISDMRQGAVFVFDDKGKFLFSTLPFIGQGPGEYIGMADFCINPFSV